MGTVNYKTSEYITIGLEPFDSEDYMDDCGEVNYVAMNCDYDDMWDNIRCILDKYNFYYFHVTMEPGYYEGFSINIENNYDICYDSYTDKREAQKEVTQLKNFLLECVNNGLCEVWPGWCTSYKGYEESIKAICQAMKDLKARIKSIPTWYTCQKLGIEI